MAEPVNDGLAQSETRVNPVVDLYTGMDEQTYFKSPLVSVSFRPPFNPDELWQKTGSYKIYEDMALDDQVSVCLRLKKDLILGDGGMFIPGDKDQDDIIEDLNMAFGEDYGDECNGDFDNELEEILSGYEFGFSLTEKIFKIRDNGNLGISGLRTRHPNSWRLHQDVKGHVTKYEQITVDGNMDINPKSLLHYVNDPKFQNPYGNSDLRTAYMAWFTKRQVVKWYAIFLEKSASPIPVGRYDKNAPQSAIDKLFESLKRFQSKTQLVVPKEIELEFLEAKSTGDAYAKALHFFNMVIGRSLFVPDLVGFTGSETGGGSLALGKEQINMFFKHIIRRRKNLEMLINRHLVKPILMYNHGILDDPPIFKFKPLNDMEAAELAKTWLDAVKGKVFQANPEEINHFRKLVKFPEGEVEFVAPPPPPVIGGLPGAPGPDMPKPGEPGYDPNAEPPKPGEMDPNKMPPANEDAADEGIKDNEVPPAEADKPEADPKETKPEDKKLFGKVYNLPPGSYYKKVNFKAIETKLKDYDQSVLNDTQKLIKKMMADLFDQIERKKIVQGANADRIDTLQLKYKKELKQILKTSFISLYKDAKSQASTEILKGVYAKPVTNEQFLEMIETETFQFVGDYEYGILKRVRAELIAAIKDGKSLASIQDVLDRDMQELSDVQLERFARTKHTEVMNNARVDFFNESGVVAAYQYSAVLDNATSDICSGLDGKIFESGDEPIPPMHFNCRSVLIPITKYEEYKPSETVGKQPIDDFIEENKGTGFATK